MRKKIGLGKKKDLNADLNLTPFIDLLSTCVCFLLITAVWIEIGSVEIKQSLGTEAAESKNDSFDIDLVYKSPKLMHLNLKRNGKRVKTSKVESSEASSFHVLLSQKIEGEMKKYKNKIIEISTATVTPRSSVNYGHLVQTLDALRSSNIINIGVLSSKGN